MTDGDLIEIERCRERSNSLGISFPFRRRFRIIGLPPNSVLAERQTGF